MNFSVLLSAKTVNGFTGITLRVIDWSAFTETFGPESAMTVGVFDGVHLGHRELVKRIVNRGPNPTVVTFRENPKKIISPGTYEGDIFSLKQKLAAFESLGVSRVILIDFSENFSKIKGRDFFNFLSERGKMVFLSIGRNFRCGFKQDTGAESVGEMNEKKGIPTELVPPVENGNIPVSSSRIRSAILRGDISLAAALMGRTVELDLSDLNPAGVKPVYDLRSARRIVPETGRYPVLIYPGAVRCEMAAENGKIFLPAKAERLEFIIEPMVRNAQ
jgi:riboflavin kinase/FMN adenylyltransferase